jgi:hypothetical protein
VEGGKRRVGASKQWYFCQSDWLAAHHSYVATIKAEESSLTATEIEIKDVSFFFFFPTDSASLKSS